MPVLLLGPGAAERRQEPPAFAPAGAAALSAGDRRLAVVVTVGRAGLLPGPVRPRARGPGQILATRGRFGW